MDKEYIQLPPLPADLEADALKVIWEYLKLSNEEKECVLFDMKRIIGETEGEYEVPENYRRIPNAEIEDYVETLRELIQCLTWQASDIAAWVFVRKIIKGCSLDEMIEELPHAEKFIIIMDTLIDKNLHRENEEEELTETTE